jgi:hypothetical protein
MRVRRSGVTDASSRARYSGSLLLSRWRSRSHHGGGSGLHNSWATSRRNQREPSTRIAQLHGSSMGRDCGDVRAGTARAPRAERPCEAQPASRRLARSALSRTDLTIRWRAITAVWGRERSHVGCVTFGSAGLRADARIDFSIRDGRPHERSQEGQEARGEAIPPTARARRCASPPARACRRSTRR